MAISIMSAMLSNWAIGGCPHHESIQKLALRPLLISHETYLDIRFLESIMNFQIEDPFQGSKSVNTLDGWVLSKYLACIIWHHLETRLVYIFQINFPPKALLQCFKLWSPTLPWDFWHDLFYREFKGIFLSFVILLLHRKSLMSFCSCWMTDEGALRTNM